MKNFDKNDIIEFGEEKIKVLVLASYILNGEEYLYVSEITDDEKEATGRYDILRVNVNNATLINVRDKEVLNELLPIFQKILLEDKE